MTYRETITQIADYRRQIETLRQKMRALQDGIEPAPVDDYVFQTGDGEVALSELFGGKRHLFVIHNMGRSCAYCTLWADGYNGIYDHLANRAAFLVSSPDAPDVQATFAASRGWRFPMISCADNGFAADMGYRDDNGYQPGVSVFRLIDGRPHRLSDTAFGPGDDFSPFWHFFDLVPAGERDDWHPKFHYG